MEKNVIIRKTINAPRDSVWSAWTNEDELAKWWGPRGVTIPDLEVDAKPGGEIYIVMLAGKELGSLAGQRWPMKGKFHDVVRPSKLVFSNQAVDENNQILIDGLTTVTFEEGEQGKTKLTIEVAGKAMTKEAEVMIAGMEQGWKESIEKLAELLENAQK